MPPQPHGHNVGPPLFVRPAPGANRRPGHRLCRPDRLLQYLGPSIQFVLGVFLYHEPLSVSRSMGFALIWGALAVYSAESWRVMRRLRSTR